VLSFDVEEHYLIEAAAGLQVGEDLRRHYQERVDVVTRWLLERLAAFEVRATFYIVGHIARHNSALIRQMHDAGHEVASHGWDHTPLHRLTPSAFQADLRKSKAVIEDITGTPVAGFRAPTFSLGPHTAWAIDVLAEEGFRYDSSIYPIYHDRYGVPQAPRRPFLVRGANHSILELPPLTYRLLGVNIPVGGGGYFRLLPPWFMRRGILQMRQLGGSGLAMLYFHPWEFDAEQYRLPLGPLSRFRTYVGIRRNRQRLEGLLRQQPFVRAIDAAAAIGVQPACLDSFSLSRSN
jgi:polysaccharide deacetylase family protein (PEP-CTERM system associated)